MQSSLAIVLSLTLGFSPHPCVSIIGTGHHTFPLEAFPGSWLHLLLYSTLVFPSASRLLVISMRISLHARYLACSGSSIRRIRLAFSVTPSLYDEYRILYLFSIDYASRPRLRSRLTQSGRTFLWKPWVFGAWDSHPRSATHTGILSSMISTRPFGRTSPFMERSPTIPWDP